MAKDNTADLSVAAGEVRELRRAALDLGKALRSFGKSDFLDAGEDAPDDADTIARESQRLAHALQERFGQLEKRAEKSLKEHPGTWAAGLLGVIGFGLVLGLILRHRD
jgi:hypothetical protein